MILEACPGRQHHPCMHSAEKVSEAALECREATWESQEAEHLLEKATPAPEHAGASGQCHPPAGLAMTESAQATLPISNTAHIPQPRQP